MTGTRSHIIRVGAELHGKGRGAAVLSYSLVKKVLLPLLSAFTTPFLNSILIRFQRLSP